MILQKKISILIERISNQMSEVTVCISLYNYEQYIQETLESVKTQTLAPLDLIVVDDQSTDNSLAITEVWLRKNSGVFNQVKLVSHQKNQGLSWSRNTAILLAETPYVFILDADNLLYPRCIERCLEALSSDPNAAMSYPLIEKFHEEEGLIGNVVWEKSSFLQENYIDAMSLIRRSALLQVDGYSYLEAIGPLGWEDYDLWCKFIDAGLYGVPIGEILARYRLHKASMLNSISNQNSNAKLLRQEMMKLYPWLNLSIKGLDNISNVPDNNTDHLIKEEDNSSEISDIDILEGFNWQEYLELNPDLQDLLKTEEEVNSHFIQYGHRENRKYLKKHLYYDHKTHQERKVSLDKFDWKFYVDYNKDLLHLRNYEEAYAHWNTYGKKEGRVASSKQLYSTLEAEGLNIPNDFDWQSYIDLNIDLKKVLSSEWDAIEHYVRSGQYEKRMYRLEHLYQRPDVAEKSNLPNFVNNLKADLSSKRLAVFFHLYYFDLWEEIREYIRHISEDFDFFVNVVSSVWTPEIHSTLRNDFPFAKIFITENRGKDIGGQLASMSNIDFNIYDVFCLIHTKKSPHVSPAISNQWRKNLLDAILGNPGKVKENLKIIRQDPSVGLIGSRYWRNTEVLNNSEHYYRLLDEFEISEGARECEYLSGTMMLVKPQIWKTIYDKFADIELEDGDGKDLDFQRDGQVAHALERIVGNLVRHQGLRFFWRD